MAILQFTKLEKARIAGSIAEGTALLCEAWMHFAGGETSAGRPGTTRMMFLAVFYAWGIRTKLLTVT